MNTAPFIENPSFTSSHFSQHFIFSPKGSVLFYCVAVDVAIKIQSPRLLDRIRAQPPPHIRIIRPIQCQVQAGVLVVDVAGVTGFDVEAGVVGKTRVRTP